jgi:stage V sporulation protein G
MKIKAQIDRMANDENAKVKAYASATFDGQFAVHGIRVLEGKNGLFASMPSTSYKDHNGNTQYNDTFHAISKDSRQALNDTVVGAYEQRLHMREDESQEQKEPEESDEETEGPAMSM